MKGDQIISGLEHIAECLPCARPCSRGWVFSGTRDTVLVLKELTVW